MLFKTDFTGNIWKNKLFWEAGYHFSYFNQGYKNQYALNYDKINKNKDENKVYPVDDPTIFDLYRQWGIISEDEAWGGINSTLRFGLLFDTRDKEAAPSKGIWAEAHVTVAPKWLGTTNPHYRYSATFRHYVPIVKNDVLTFAYRLNYEGTFGNSAPYYVLPYITVMGSNYDRDGMGGYRTVRGLMRNRVQGLDMATYNVELRWRFVNFTLWKQNIAFGLSAFSDGTMVTRNYDMSFKSLTVTSSDAPTDTPECRMTPLPSPVSTRFETETDERSNIPENQYSPEGKYTSETSPSRGAPAATAAEFAAAFSTPDFRPQFLTASMAPFLPTSASTLSSFTTSRKLAASPVNRGVPVTATEETATV